MSKVNDTMKSLSCDSFGSKVCLLDQSYSNSILDITISCVRYCQFDLRLTSVLSPSKLSLGASNGRSLSFPDPTSLYIFSVDVPEVSSALVNTHVLFSFDSLT
jgi:hypothetical protein